MATTVPILVTIKQIGRLKIKYIYDDLYQYIAIIVLRVYNAVFLCTIVDVYLFYDGSVDMQI